MVAATLSVVVVLGAGLTAGVLFAVALSVLPALRAMPASRYVYAHQLIGRHWDPTMPVIVMGSTALAVVLAVLQPGPARVLDTAGAVLLAAVSVVSHFGNVPLNRTVKVLDPEHIPPDWSDPRPVWRRLHLVRTVLSIVALGVLASALLVVT